MINPKEGYYLLTRSSEKDNYCKEEVLGTFGISYAIETSISSKKYFIFNDYSVESNITYRYSVSPYYKGETWDEKTVSIEKKINYDGIYLFANDK
jgi:hypothetical protein